MNRLTSTSILILGSLLSAAPAGAQGIVQKLVPSDPDENDFFGNAVDVCRDLAIVGNRYDRTPTPQKGSAYVYRKTRIGWREEAKLVHGPVADGPYFGSSVAIFDSWAAVGAPYDSTAGANAGSVIIYRGGASGWAEVRKLVPIGTGAGDFFGNAVALRGSTLAIGSHRDEPVGTNSGSVYIYELQPPSWTFITKLHDPGGQTDDYFGEAVALNATGTRLAVGSIGDNASGVNAGAVHVYERQGTSWTLVDEIYAPDASDGDEFGSGVGIFGDTIVAGAPGRTEAFVVTGIGYAFERQGATWNHAATFTQPSGVTGGYLGETCGVSLDRVIFGLRTDHWTGPSSGSARVYRPGLGGWAFETRLLPADADVNDEFGKATAIWGDTIFATTWRDDDGATDAGATYVAETHDYATSYCFCEAAAPCGNDFGAAGCATSNGLGARLLAGGSNSVAEDDLVLSARGVPRDQFGLLYMGMGTIEVPFGDGLRCVSSGGAGLFRFPAMFSGTEGLIQLGPGLVEFTQTSFPFAGQIRAGQTWNFQAWFRDPGGPCNRGFNLSNAVGVVFRP